MGEGGLRGWLRGIVGWGVAWLLRWSIQVASWLFNFSLAQFSFSQKCKIVSIWTDYDCCFVFLIQRNKGIKFILVDTFSCLQTFMLVERSPLFCINQLAFAIKNQILSEFRWARSNKILLFSMIFCLNYNHSCVPTTSYVMKWFGGTDVRWFFHGFMHLTRAHRESKVCFFWQHCIIGCDSVWKTTSCPVNHFLEKKKFFFAYCFLL